VADLNEPSEAPSPNIGRANDFIFLLFASMKIASIFF